MPEAQALARIRHAIDRRPHLMKQSLLGAGLRKEFLEGASLDGDKVARALAAQNQGNALKTKPKVSKPLTTRVFALSLDRTHSRLWCCSP